MQIVVASNNRGKIEEFRHLLKLPNIELLSLEDIGFKEEIIENGSTFYENALIKAKTVYDKYHIPTLADDSGLEVEALDGAPGIYTARFYNLVGAKEKRDKLLEVMEGVENRKAKFHCSLVLIDQKGIHEFVGEMAGFIGYYDKGENGFGYDPIFWLKDGRSNAELEMEEKNAISHRGLAVKELRCYLNGTNN